MPACARCHAPDPERFFVPNHIWRDVVTPRRRAQVLCLTCFGELADKQRIDWRGRVVFYERPQVTHAIG